jgi:hypothetical protein
MNNELKSEHRRFVIAFTSINALLAVAHILPPSAQFFMVERAFLAIAKVIQGPLELLAFSILIMNGIYSPAFMFLTISFLALVLAFTCGQMRLGNDVLPSLIFIYVLIGLSAAYAGNILVSQSSSCVIELSPTLSQKVVVYDEYGWNPGAYYFLLEREDSSSNWSQVDWVRLEQPITNPCESIDSVFR